MLLALLVGQLLSFDLLIVATRPLFDVLGRCCSCCSTSIVIPLAYVIQWIVYLVLALLPAGHIARRPSRSAGGPQTTRLQVS